ncbi:tyrosine-type recombinase/integrase [Nonomuraea dietziae]|uniref:tyrosine-type recombinase/integrase n=1 Tax=Nonomuraea dietziae TaxID=65515 RepID=UPI0033D70864
MIFPGRSDKLQGRRSLPGLIIPSPSSHPSGSILTPELVEVIRRHASAHNQKRLQAGRSWTEHGLMFPTSFGNPSDPDTFSHLFSRLTRKAGLGRRHPHELRHSGASLMLAQRTPLHVVSEVLGHASIAIYEGCLRASAGGREARGNGGHFDRPPGETVSGGSQRRGRHRMKAPKRQGP